jgi:ComF family protein
MVNNFRLPAPVCTLLSHLLPPSCLLCAGPAGNNRDLCAGCLAELPFTRFPCPRCALPLPTAEASCGHCLSLPPPWGRCVAPLLYRPPASQLVAAFKYRGQVSGGRLLTSLLSEQLHRSGCEVDLIVPVPLHWRRRWQRGFNQAELIADQLSAALRIPVAMRAVRRVRPTTAQQQLDARARARNLRGAFTLNRPLAGSRVALVDDVVTTGATAAELTRLLLKGGAAAVELWALARTPPG